MLVHWCSKNWLPNEVWTKAIFQSAMGALRLIYIDILKKKFPKSGTKFHIPDAHNIANETHTHRKAETQKLMETNFRTQSTRPPVLNCRFRSRKTWILLLLPGRLFAQHQDSSDRKRCYFITLAVERTLNSTVGGWNAEPKDFMTRFEDDWVRRKEERKKYTGDKEKNGEKLGKSRKWVDRKTNGIAFNQHEQIMKEPPTKVNTQWRRWINFLEENWKNFS